jgi:hypothetical protein
MKFKEWLQTLPVEKLDEFAATATATSPLWLPKVISAIGAAGTLGTLYKMTRKKDSPGQMKLPGFEGDKKKETSWGHNVVDKTREFFKNRRTAAKTKKVNQALSDRARAIENAKRKERGEGEVTNRD